MGIQAEQKGVGEPCQPNAATQHRVAADRRMSVQTIHPLCEQARVGWLIRTDAWLYRKTFYITMVDSFGSVFYDETDRGGAGRGSKA